MPFFTGVSQYNPGDYFCVDIRASVLSPPWFADQAIKYFTKSTFCHSALITSGLGDIIEARPHGGVTRANISKYDGMTKVFSNTSLTLEQRMGIVHFAENLVGKDSYNFLGVCYLGWYLKGNTSSWLTEKIASDAAEDNQTFCSQLVAMAGRANNVTSWMCNKPYATLVTPANLTLLAVK